MRTIEERRVDLRGELETGVFSTPSGRATVLLAWSFSPRLHEALGEKDPGLVEWHLVMGEELARVCEGEDWEKVAKVTAELRALVKGAST